jgi:hypothetical protein
MTPLSLEVKLILAAVFALVLYGSGVYTGWELGGVRYSDLKAADAALDAVNVKMAAATQHQLDQNSIAAANADAALARQQAALAHAQIKVVHDYVTKFQDAHNCITYGLLRVYDAAAIGTTPGTLSLPAGATDDSCAPNIVSSQLADGIVRNFARYRLVAGRFNELIDQDAGNDAALKASGTKRPSWWERNNPF